MQVTEVTASLRKDGGEGDRPLPHFEDTRLIIELQREATSKDKAHIQRLSLCSLLSLQSDGITIPVDLGCSLRPGQLLQLKVLLGVERVKGDCDERTANTIVLTRSGLVSCQLRLPGVVCNVYICVELTKGPRCGTAEDIDRASYQLIPILVPLSEYVRGTFWPLYCLFFLFLFLVNVANNASDSIGLATIHTKSLHIQPGDIIQSGSYLSGCIQSNDSHQCNWAVLALHGKAIISFFLFVYKLCHVFSV